MSQLDSQSKTIGLHNFEVFKLNPLDAQDVLIDITQAIGPALGKGVGALKEHGLDDILDKEVGSTDAASVIGELVGGLSKAKMRELVGVMAGVSHCDGKKLTTTMNVVFRGDLPLMYGWLWFALEVNFGNFIGWVSTAIRDGVQTLAAQKSLNTSGGTGPQ